jgi:pre-mRNA-processing factor 40
MHSRLDHVLTTEKVCAAPAATGCVQYAARPAGVPMSYGPPPTGGQPRPQIPPHGAPGLQSAGQFTPRPGWGAPVVAPTAARPASSTVAGRGLPAAATAARPARPPTVASAAVRCDWTEHRAPDGRMYYYNAKLGKSVWVKPQELIIAEAESRAAAVLAACPWKEHKAPDERLYYHNKGTKQSVWKVPEELTAARAQAARIRSVAVGGAHPEPAAASSVQPAAPVQPTLAAGDPARGAAVTGDFMYATKDEAKKEFKAFLTEAEPALDAKWDALSESLAARGDRRFSALKSNGERASCFKEWLADRRADAARAQEAAAAAQRAAFIQLLDAKATVLMGGRFSKAEAVCFEDQRWEALPEAQRQSTFQEWVETRRREAEAAARAATLAQVLY